MRKVEVTQSEKKDFTKFWTVVAVFGLLFFVAASVVGANFKINAISQASFMGLVIAIFPLILFQFNLFAGLSDLKLELSDLKSLWFFVFNILFFVIDAFMFSGINLIFLILPGFKEADILISADYFNVTWPYFAAVYAIIIVAGLIYRRVHRIRPYKMVIA
jgi:hypothetical protein